MENPKKITVFRQENFHFGPIRFLQKMALKANNIISKPDLKKHILALFFCFFGSEITRKNIFLNNSNRVFDSCMNCYIWLKKNFEFFLGKGPPLLSNMDQNFGGP
jgi:hypothetical protein